MEQLSQLLSLPSRFLPNAIDAPDLYAVNPPYLAIILACTLLSSLSFLLPFLQHDAEQPVQYSVEEPEQSQPGWRGDMLGTPSIQVEESPAIRCYCPATGEFLAMVDPATEDDIDRVVARAKDAQSEWASTSFAQRRRVLRSMLKYILDHQDLIARTACLDSGKTRIDASFGEILVTVAKLRWTIEHGEETLQASKRPTNFLMFYKKNEVRYEPLGVIAACVSWNYPFHNLLGPIISSLFTGNAIVIKGSERTAWSSTYFASIAQEALKACGHSPALIQSIVCWPATAPHLVSHPDIAHLTFVGSREVAHKVASSPSKSLTPLCLELGGKDPVIVLDDVKDIDRVVATLARGVFQSAGQNCIGIERIICQSQIYQTVIDRLRPIVESLRVGSSLHSAKVDVGASISDANFATLELLISDAVKNGARLLVGGRRLNHQEFPNGHYFSPTLLVDVTPKMRIAHVELFAPVCVVMKAESVDEAIQIANGTDYALGASVFGSESATLERVTRELKAGMVAVNDFGVYYVVQLPFGGVKGSGYGRFVGAEGLRSLCNIKSVCKDRWPSIIKTSIPGPLQLPIREEERGWNMCKGMVELGYSDTLWRRARGLGKIVGF